MAKIKRVSRVKKVSPIAKNLQNATKKLFKEAQAYEDYQKQALKDSHKKTLSQYLHQLRLLVKALSGNIAIGNSLKYIDKKRIQRAKTQLRVYFLQTIKNQDTFRFVVKSSGLNPPQSYYVDIHFRDLEVMALTDTDYKDILLKSRIKTQCSCDDFKYRFRYWLTQMGAVLGVKEYRYPKITNPHNEHMFLCKHQALVFNGIQKPSFRDGIFKRFVENKIKDKATRVTAKDREKTLRASYRATIKDT